VCHADLQAPGLEKQRSAYRKKPARLPGESVLLPSTRTSPAPASSGLPQLLIQPSPSRTDLKRGGAEHLMAAPHVTATSSSIGCRCLSSGDRCFELALRGYGKADH